jgi:NADH:ubiquinone oxidoreductase subunit 3 (subunit A)
MIAVYILIAILVISAIALLMGKGSWLIAGYNTASKKEKEKYDEKKLCRCVGIMLLLISVIFGAISYVKTEKFAETMIIFIILIVIIGLIYANKFCYKK